jgi:hypothetical protein
MQGVDLAKIVSGALAESLGIVHSFKPYGKPTVVRENI